LRVDYKRNDLRSRSGVFRLSGEEAASSGSHSGDLRDNCEHGSIGRMNLNRSVGIRDRERLG
jgi:hypothetical protein